MFVCVYSLHKDASVGKFQNKKIIIAPKLYAKGI